MFSVIGVDGGVFRGSLEHLLTTHRVPALPHLRGLDQDGEEAPPGLALPDYALPVAIYYPPEAG